MGIANLEHSQITLNNTHESDQCWRGPCTIHNRSDHPMRSFPQHWRSDRGLMERICEHNVGHPDPDIPHDKSSYEWVHACDGCCRYEWGWTSILAWNIYEGDVISFNQNEELRNVNAYRVLTVVYYVSYLAIKIFDRHEFNPRWLTAHCDAPIWLRI